MRRIQCFEWIDIKRDAVYLRRYSASDDSQGKCPGKWGYHNGHTYIEEIESIRDKDGYKTFPENEPPHDDPRWPTKCDACDYKFDIWDKWQIISESIYERVDTKERQEKDQLPAGAMFDAWWSFWKGPDGKNLVCRLPNGFDWHIDGPASNCTKKDTKHYCWVRTGTVPNITVGKGTNGESCSAGAGSIASQGYHGFLKNGFLED